MTQCFLWGINSVKPLFRICIHKSWQPIFKARNRSLKLGQLIREYSYLEFVFKRLLEHRFLGFQMHISQKSRHFILLA